LKGIAALLVAPDTVATSDRLPVAAGVMVQR